MPEVQSVVISLLMVSLGAVQLSQGYLAMAAAGWLSKNAQYVKNISMVNVPVRMYAAAYSSIRNTRTHTQTYELDVSRGSCSNSHVKLHRC